MAALRARYGADLVTLIRPFNYSAQKACGVGYISGYGGAPVSRYAAYGFSVVSDGADTGGSTYYCNSYTFAHEVGHNMGSMHDRATVASQGGGTGAYPYAFGYGRSGSFGTIMSYISPRIGKFSNPIDFTCGGTQACGVSETNLANSANNALSLNNTRTAVATFMPATVATVLSISGTIYSGNAQPLSGVTVTGAGANCTATGANGVYSCTVPQKWSGTITPSLAGYTVVPMGGRAYSALQASQVNQNYVAVKPN